MHGKLFYGVGQGNILDNRGIKVILNWYNP